MYLIPIWELQTKTIESYRKFIVDSLINSALTRRIVEDRDALDVIDILPAHLGLPGNWKTPPLVLGEFVEYINFNMTRADVVIAIYGLSFEDRLPSISSLIISLNDNIKVVLSTEILYAQIMMFVNSIKEDISSSSLIIDDRFRMIGYFSQPFIIVLGDSLKIELLARRENSQGEHVVLKGVAVKRRK